MKRPYQLEEACEGLYQRFHKGSEFLQGPKITGPNNQDRALGYAIV